MDNRDNLANLTWKIAYHRIQPAVTHRGVIKFAEYQLDWPALWRDLDLYFVNKPVWKTNFLILHGILKNIYTNTRVPRTPIRTQESQEHLYEHCPLTVMTHNSGFVIQPLLGFRPDSSFSWQLCDIMFGSLGIRGNLRVLNQIPKCWSRRSSLLSGLSRRYNSKFFDQRFTKKNGSLGECCSFDVGRLLPLSLRAHSSRLWLVSFSV